MLGLRFFLFDVFLLLILCKKVRKKKFSVYIFYVSYFIKVFFSCGSYVLKVIVLLSCKSFVLCCKNLLIIVNYVELLKDNLKYWNLFV